MASTHNLITGTAGDLSADVRSFVDRLTALVDDGVNIKAVMDQVAAGVDWASLAMYLGLSGDNAATNAEAVYNLFGSVNTELAGAFIAQLTSRCG